MNRLRFAKLASASFFFALTVVLPGCKGALALAGVAGFESGQEALGNARKAHARMEVLNLVTGITAFYDDYNHLPEIRKGAKGDTTTDTGSALINILTGNHPGQNPKNQRYFAGRPANQRMKGGLVALPDGAGHKLLDAWGNPYHVRMDTDYDEELLEPPGDRKKLIGRIAIAWSAGPDGLTNPDPEHPDNEDNVYSWR